MELSQFWSMIEAAWQEAAPQHTAARDSMAQLDDEAREELAQELEEPCELMYSSLLERLDALLHQRALVAHREEGERAFKEVVAVQLDQLGNCT